MNIREARRLEFISTLPIIVGVLLAGLWAIHASAQPTKVVSPTLKDANQLFITGDTRLWKMPVFDESNVLFKVDGQLVLRVLGMAPKIENAEPLTAMVDGWVQPKNPDSVKIELTTTDGRHWRAKWEEMKP